MSLLNNLEITETVLKNKPYTSSFLFRHLPAGMGIVIGNYLRQFLLKYTSGIAPFGAEISDKNGTVEVEESFLVGVEEVTPYLILNLKQIIVEEKKNKEGVFCLELNVENKENKEKIITAGDFQKDKDIEIKNPELHVATLAPAGSLKIKLYFQKNWGYHEHEKKESIIPFDTDYSPVKGGGVNFKVNSLVNSEEELTLTITTNGSIKPKKALQEVLELSGNSFNAIADLISSEKKITEIK